MCAALVGKAAANLVHVILVQFWNERAVTDPLIAVDHYCREPGRKLIHIRVADAELFREVLAIMDRQAENVVAAPSALEFRHRPVAEHAGVIELRAERDL